MLSRPFLEILQAFVPLNFKIKVEAGPSRDSAGMVVDAVSCAKSVLDRGIGDASVGPRVILGSPRRHSLPITKRAHTEVFVSTTNNVNMLLLVNLLLQSVNIH